MNLSVKAPHNEPSVASKRKLETTFIAGGLVEFLDTSKILLIAIVLHNFSHLFLAL